MMSAGSIGADQPSLEEVDLCAPIHLALYHFEPIDLAFGLPVGPWFGDGRTHGVLVVGDAAGEGRQQAVAHAKAQARPEVAIDAEMTTRFSSLVAEELTTGDIDARKASLRSIIDTVEVGDRKVRIVGRKSTLRDAIAGKATSVSGFDRKWRATRNKSANAYVIEIAI
jgi:hypothetical protein